MPGVESYYARNRERIRAQQKAYKATARGQAVNHACSSRWSAAHVRRGVVTWRLKEPRGVAAWRARLRWKLRISQNLVSLVDSQGEGSSMWVVLEVFARDRIKAIRTRERFFDAESARGLGAQWLKGRS
jgi:hypothetical protein